MANEIRQFLRDHGISEVEAIIPDMAGIARGKIMPAEKFAEDEGMRLPESIFLQTVTGDYPPDTDKAMSPAEIDIILNTNRTQTFEPDIFSNLGIDPLGKEILLVKSTNHFHAGFVPIAAEIIYIDAGAPYPSNPRVTDYKKLSREIWPRVENPHG
jgi:hypothetical protein